MSKSLTAASVTGAVTLSFVLAACGGPGGPGGGGDASGLSDDKIVIGVLNDQTAAYKDLSGPNSVTAVKMAVEDWKKAHGDDAVTTDVEVISSDFQNKPDLANTQARQMYDRENADVILDVPNSAAALAVANVAKSNKKLFINVGAGTSALTGEQCNPYTYHWAYDTWMLSNGAAATITKNGGKKWSIVYPDYEFGTSSDGLYTKAIEAAGGEVVSHIPTPFPNDNFATYITKALQGGPDVVASMHGGADFANFMKQFRQAGGTSGTQVVGGVVFLSDIRSIGAKNMEGAQFTDAWYWNMDDQSRTWAERFKKEAGVAPSSVHAGNYSAAYQYLESVQAVGSDEADKVNEDLEGKEINDMFLRNGKVRAEDHRVIHDVYLAQVKKASEVKADEDWEKIVATIPAKDAFMPLSESSCSM